jgi:N-acetylglucosamine malate deacetylase 1
VWKLRKVLVLSPHTDDAEFGMGGTIARLLSEGVEVHVVAFCNAKDSLPQGWHPETLIDEMKASMATMAVPEQNIHFLDYPVRQFPRYRQEILDDLIKLKRAIEPDAVFVHASTDVHQDHSTVHIEAVRAFKTISIFGYELPWNTITFNADCLVALEDEHVQAKIAAVAAYKSQQGRSYASEEFIKGWTRGRGVTINVHYAEAFEVIRLVMR